jgi:predicted  nucleic acid-binding Zn-ribbon protein
LLNNVDSIKKDLSTVQKELPAIKTSVDAFKKIEQDLMNMKNSTAADKLEKEVLSLRADHEKCFKELKALSTEVKFVDSSLKKESSNTKSEITSVSKSIKGRS